MKEFQKYNVKLKGDAGIYNVFIIDWINMKIFIDRTCTSEWVGFEKIKEIIQVEDFYN